MDWQEYVKKATRTAPEQGPDAQLKQAIFGMVGELGEVREAAIDEMADECGDCAWYLALAYDATGVALDLPGDPYEARPDVRRYGGAIGCGLCEAAESYFYQGDETALPEIGELLVEYAWWLEDVCPVSMEDVRADNIRKLRDRHGESFTPAEGQDR